MEPFDFTSLDRRLALQAADALVRQNEIDLAVQQPQFAARMYTNEYTPLGDITDYISCTATFKRNAVGTATIVLKGDDPLVDYAMACAYTVVPITIGVNGMRWSGRVDTCSDDMVNGVSTVTLQCVQDWNWFNHILCWPNPLFPIEVQFPKEFIAVGPAVSVIEFLITINAIRLQLGLWEIVNNILDPAAWFATAMEKEGLLTPIAVVPTNLLTDTSKWVAISTRMDTVATIVTQICKDNGLSLTADLWLPGEPQPTDAFTLTVPTIVVRVVDKSGVTGPTGTIIDGLIEDAAEIVDGAFGEVVNPLQNSQYLPPGVVIAPEFGVNWTPPWPVYYVDNPRSGVKECHVNAHHPLAYTVVGGGKSPRWVNQLIDLLLELLLSEILVALGASGISSTLLDGIFDDVILAFQEFENAPRRAKLGAYGYPEFFTSTGSTAYTVDEFFALEIAMWDTRGYYSSQIVTYDGIPYKFGKDFGVGDLVSWVRRGKMYTDYVDEATVVDDRNTRVELTAKIGDLSAQESPWARIQRRLTSFESAMQIALLSSN
ncbi:Gp37-like protein [Nocardia africana]